ncbi:hypothetical protein Fmac_011412 [Flemingia macrophylla]|uniref:Peptidase M28 domain-containing protein n=1 Tax=Flemingia macrophylla TaxID=520843 RepID=A0ABD1MMC2_9FABA
MATQQAAVFKEWLIMKSQISHLICKWARQVQYTWISSVDSKDTDPSVLVNGHFDSPLSSPGAGDCGSCVGDIYARNCKINCGLWLGSLPPSYFLFNGAEELFMLGSHGFMKTHKWRDTIGAFINVEASGTGGPGKCDFANMDPVLGLLVSMRSKAIYPMANSAAQEDVFPIIPGDTDYRIFSEDYGNIPGLDIIFLLGGYFYHTSYDTVERLIPGSIQARGENLSHSWSAALWDFIKGFLLHAIGIILAIIIPVMFSILSLLFSSQTMNCFFSQAKSRSKVEQRLFEPLGSSSELASSRYLTASGDFEVQLELKLLNMLLD